MGAELPWPENDDIPSVPPGFESFASFSLKRVQDTKKQDNEIKTSCSPSKISSDAQSVQSGAESGVADSSKITTRPPRRRGIKIKYGNFDGSSGDESECVKREVVCALAGEKLWPSLPQEPSLPQGVLRGCPECINCQKQVTARWRPEDACKPVLEDCPVFYPTEEEFQDTLKYIATIRPKAEPYGICRIVPPSSWKPPCPLKDKTIWETSKFLTRVQKVDKLQNRGSIKKMSKIHHSMKKKRKCMKVAVNCGTDGGIMAGPSDSGFGFGFEPGPEFTLSSFQKYADYFKAEYFSKKDAWEPSVDNIEGEYWRIVEKATEQIEVLYGADLETGAFGSGFPKSNQFGSDETYTKSGWNLNNFPRLPGSVLSYESGDISGVLVPWLYIGMCFSSFCWHVEDHHLYSLNYLHWGAPKLWYGVPGKDAVKLEEAMQKQLPQLFVEQPDLLHKLVTQFSPSMLKSEGVPVYRCVQNAGEFVLTFPRAYHSGFNTGFNCAEAVNVAPVDWLSHGLTAINLYREQARKTSISHDKLLLGAAREAVRALWELNLLKKNTLDNFRWKDVCGKDGILAEALKMRVQMERVSREVICQPLRGLKMDKNFDATCERECCVCFYDLHLSAAGCRCSPDKYACLYHANEFCPCSWDTKFFLFRYDIGELNVLADAMEGKLGSVYRWARLDLGLSLASYVARDKTSISPERSANNDKTFLKEINISSTCQNSVICLTDDEDDGLKKPVIIKTEEVKLPECSGRLIGSDSKVSLSNNKSETILTALVTTDALVIHQKDAHSLPEGQGSNCTSYSIQVKEEPNSQNPSSPASCSSTELKKHAVESSNDKLNTVTSGRPNTVIKHEKVGSNLTLSSLGTVNNHIGNSSSAPCLKNRKGPRIAKVVRRINCVVEPLEFGMLLPRKSWCNSQAIFPKGFRSRVRYISVVDPTTMCYYISEILDAGYGGPLFKVSVEDCSSEVFIHLSATKCWEMVRDKVNQEISKQHKLGRINLSPIQPPGSLDGYEFFGFSSPAIVQVIEGMDKNRVCTDYWDSRPYSRPQVQILNPQIKGIGGTSADKLNSDGCKDIGLPEGVNTILKGLFKKATHEELNTLLNILSDNRTPASGELVTKLLAEESNNQRR
ncbi:hypothetical protein ACFE04_025159 [Oxalis oulophora]